jgi:hypothetical protein
MAHGMGLIGPFGLAGFAEALCTTPGSVSEMRDNVMQLSKRGIWCNGAMVQ